MNKVLFGIEKCYIAKITETEDGIEYGKPFRMPGVTGFTMDPQGESTQFYADNIVYFTATSNQGYNGNLVLATTPEKFWIDIMGQEKDSNGAIFENADDKIARFALLFQGEGDKSARRHVLFDCTATRPSREYNTKEQNISVGTDTIPITINPRSRDKAIKAYIEPNEQNKNIYDKFFEKVYEKNVQVEQAGV